MDYLITDFGAVADYVDEVPLPACATPDSPRATNNRPAIQTAIDAAHAAGGGRVIVPTGRFFSGSLVLKSNVTLHLETGAWLVASLDLADGIDFAAEFDDDTENAGWTGGCFLFARHAENIAIEGSGTIYGQGDKVFYDDGADGDLHECPKNVHVPAWERPRTTFFEDVENLTVRGVTFRDAAFWTLHMAGCRHVIVDGVRILNDERGANNDGIDPDTCTDVVITNCIVKTGDDAIVVKNTPPMAAKYGACENVVISNCVLYSHDSALKIGTETALAIRNVLLSDCVFRDCSRGVGIWARDGATIEDIHVHHVSGSTRRYADCPERDFAPRWWGKGEPIFISATPRRAPTAEMPGHIRNVTFDHVYMTCEAGVFIAGEGDVAAGGAVPGVRRAGAGAASVDVVNACATAVGESVASVDAAESGAAESGAVDVGAGPLIEGVDISDLYLTQRVSGTQGPGVFDEQPSVRDVYAHEVPAVYVRGAADVRVCGRVRREGVFRDLPLTQVEGSRDVTVELDER